MSLKTSKNCTYNVPKGLIVECVEELVIDSMSQVLLLERVFNLEDSFNALNI